MENSPLAAATGQGSEVCQGSGASPGSGKGLKPEERRPGGKGLDLGEGSEKGLR